MLKSTGSRQELASCVQCEPMAGIVRTDAVGDADALDGSQRPVVTQPRRALPLVAADVAMGDWDDLFKAIGARLTAMAGNGETLDIRLGVLECAGAMDQLHESMVRERARGRKVELELGAARIERARVELIGARTDEWSSRQLSLHDELKSLPNRGFFDAWLDRALAHAESAQEWFAVLYLDLDDFKAINDVHGHDVADELLRIVASRLARSVRAEDAVSHMGGDKFACLLSHLPSREQLSHLACKLFDAVSAPVRIGAHELTVRPSIGIALCPADGATPDDLLRNADAAMVHAKRQQSGYAFFDRRQMQPLGAVGR